MKHSFTNHRAARVSAGRFAFAAFVAVMATAGWSPRASALPNQPCLNAAFGTDTNCNANDIAVAKVAVTGNLIDGCNGDPGDTFTFNGAIDITLSAQTRYDIGVYAGVNPETSTNSDCSVGVIDPTIETGANDGDACGDVGENLTGVAVQNVTGSCTPDANGFF